ncbi:MAG TPA: type II secretion system F family protein [Planctomycetaceae bacterium]|nr:type II secretion system F family protein [Planctomycetaceae bacterium]
MPSFAYTAYTQEGDKVSGSVTAVNEREALSVLTGKSLYPLEVAPQEKRVLWRGRRIKGQTMAVFYGQLAGLLRSGVPLLRSLSVLREQAADERLKMILAEIHQQVEDGASLAEAMARFPKAFTEMSINMVRAGGEGGFLEEALERVAAFTEQQEDLKARTAGAMAYPAFLAVAGTVIVTVLIVFFVPKFEELFAQLRERGELPALTIGLLGFSRFLQSWGLVMLLVGLVVGVLAMAQMRSDRGRYLVDFWKLKLPLLGAVFRNLAVARFCRVLGTLLRNGVPILRSLEISREATGNRILSEAIETASENVTAGESLATPLKASGHFPPTVIEMIVVAEESNTLEKVLVETADQLERQTARRLDLAVRLLEPILLLVLAGCVLLVVIALLVPVIKMSSAI